MILVSCRNDSYLYNAYHMVKAFFPEEEVHSSVEEKASHLPRQNFRMDPDLFWIQKETGKG